VKPRLKAGACFAFALSLLLSLMVPVMAHADMTSEAPGWPKRLVTSMTPDGMTAFSNDTMSFVNCGNAQQAESFQYIHEGINSSSLPIYNSQTGGTICNLSNDVTASDGTFYTTYMVDTPNRTFLTFVAMKNGRTVWSTDLSSDPQCSAASGQGNNAQNATMINPVIGPDGNIYGIVQSSYSGCATYLTGISGLDGHLLFKNYLSNGSIALPTRLWLYSDKMLVVDTTGLLRKYDYTGNEDTSRRYQFSVPVPGSGKTFGPLYANAQGRVFALDWCWGSGTMPLQYHDLNGQSGTLDTQVGCNPQGSFTPAANGDLVFVSYDANFRIIHIGNLTVTSQGMPLPPGASSVYVGGYWQDQNGNTIVVRQMYGPNWTSVGVSVDEIDAATSVITNIYLQGVDSSHPAPSLRAVDISTDGYLYAMICHDVNQCPNTASTSIDGWVHKISLTGFGTPIKDSNSFVTQIISRRSMVAMGDSYSGGEGNPPFEATTDTSSDQCHRSGFAYPWSVSYNAVLNLKLTDFTACTGATVWLMENGQNGEPPQLAALSNDTNVVTLTIGGNDVHFIDYVEACTWACGPGTTPYANVMAEINASSFLDSLKNLYTTILTNAPNADVYVADYPYLAPQNAGSCAGFDLSGAYNVERALNNQIALAVTQAASGDPRLHFVEVNYDESPFMSHDLCSGTASYFNGIVAPPNQVYSVHPNMNGENAYASVFTSAIQ